MIFESSKVGIEIGKPGVCEDSGPFQMREEQKMKTSTGEKMIKDLNLMDEGSWFFATNIKYLMRSLAPIFLKAEPGKWQRRSFHLERVGFMVLIARERARAFRIQESSFLLRCIPIILGER